MKVSILVNCPKVFDDDGIEFDVFLEDLDFGNKIVEATSVSFPDSAEDCADVFERLMLDAIELADIHDQVCSVVFWSLPPRAMRALSLFLMENSRRVAFWGIEFGLVSLDNSFASIEWMPIPLAEVIVRGGVAETTDDTNIEVRITDYDNVREGDTVELEYVGPLSHFQGPRWAFLQVDMEVEDYLDMMGIDGSCPRWDELAGSYLLVDHEKDIALTVLSNRPWALTAPVYEVRRLHDQQH